MTSFVGFVQARFCYPLKTLINFSFVSIVFIFDVAEENEDGMEEDEAEDEEVEEEEEEDDDDEGDEDEDDEGKTYY